MVHPNRLSDREWQVVELLLQGKSNKMIAARLDVSIRTVEFHLTNIYAKYRVASRVELILKLRDGPHGAGIENLGNSTVESLEKDSDNRGVDSPWMAAARPSTTTASIGGKESEMKHLQRMKHILTGVIAAFIAGFLWFIALSNIGSAPPTELDAWIAPMILTWSLIGASLGLIGRRYASSLFRVGFTTLFATGVSPIAILPIMGFLIYPLAKLAERVGLIDPAAIPRQAASTLVIVAMLAIWYALGLVVGLGLLSVRFRDPEPGISQTPSPESRP